MHIFVINEFSSYDCGIACRKTISLRIGELRVVLERCQACHADLSDEYGIKNAFRPTACN